MKQVRNMIILNALRKARFISFCKDTGKKVGIPFYNKKVTAYYVYDGQSFFIFRKKMYRTKYVDGCFYPFVFEVES